MMRFYRSLSIAKQLRYSIISAVAIGVIVTSLLLINISYQFQFNNLRSLQQKVTDSTANEIIVYIDDLQSKLGLLARIPGLADWDTVSLDNILEGLIRHNSAYETVAIIGSDQRVITSRSLQGTDFPESLRLSKAFENTFIHGQEYISRIQYDTQNEFPFAIFSVPIRNEQDEIDGVLLTKVNLKYLDFVISQANVGKSGYVYVVDQRLNIIAERGQPLTSNDFKSIIDNSTLSNWLRQPNINNTLMPYQGLYGSDVLGSIADIPGPGWHVISELPVEELYAPINDMLLAMGLNLLISTIIAIVISIFLLRQFINPLQHLSQVARQISIGNRNVVAHIEQKNEFGILANTFNTMVNQLNNTIQRLEEDIIERQRVEIALRESEKKYRQLVDLAQEGIWVIDADSITTFVNPSMAKMLGYTEDEMIGKHLFVFMDESNIDVSKQNLENRKNGITEQHDFELLHKDGHTVYTTMEAAPILNENGIYQGAIAGVIDISNRKLAEENRFQLELEKERTQILINFISQASHEFRTPLSIINTSLYLMSKTNDEQTQQRHTTKIKERVIELTALVEALTTLAKLENVQELALTEVNINELIQEIVLEKQPFIKFRNLISQLNLEPNLPSLYVEKDYLRQAFKHLIDNAISFTPDGGSILVSSNIQQHEFIIEVCDTGSGISADDLPHIFERFYRIDKQGTTRGLGLGLPIVERIIRLHQGRVDVKSQVGKGSNFTIYLPLSPMLNT